MRNLLVLFLCVTTLCANLCAAGTWVTSSTPSSAELTQRLDRAHWIGSGAKSPARVVYVFTDPNCPYCNDLWKAIKGMRAPDVQVRYLLVAVIDADSRGKDAAILESSDPAATLDENERKFARGGITPKPMAQAATNATISANEALMKDFQIYGTPGLVYLDEHNELKVFAGMPNPEQLRMILGNR
jgi:thiol:disulfide interchange protein DsbG